MHYYPPLTAGGELDDLAAASSHVVAIVAPHYALEHLASRAPFRPSVVVSTSPVTDLSPMQSPVLRQVTHLHLSQYTSAQSSHTLLQDRFSGFRVKYVVLDRLTTSPPKNVVAVVGYVLALPTLRRVVLRLRRRYDDPSRSIIERVTSLWDPRIWIDDVPSLRSYYQAGEDFAREQYSLDSNSVSWTCPYHRRSTV